MNQNNWMTFLFGTAALTGGAYLYIWDEAYDLGTYFMILGILGVALGSWPIWSKLFRTKE